MTASALKPWLVGTALLTSLTAVQAVEERAPEKAGARLDYLFPRIPPYRSEAPASPPRFVLEGRAPATPAQLEVYEVLSPAVDAAFVQRVAASLDMKAIPRGPDGHRWELVESGEDPSQRRSLTVYVASGALSYSLDEGRFAPTERELRLPSEREAHELALRFLKGKDLLPSDALVELQQVHFSRPLLIERSVKEKRNVKELVTGIEVRFPRALDGYRVRGPGAKLYVAFGEGTRVVGVTKVWRDVKKTGTSVPSIKPEAALQLLQQGAGVLDADDPCVQAQVLRMEVVYWMDGPKAPQRTALPVYRVEGRCLSADGKPTGEFQAYAPAVLNAPFGRTRSAQQP